MLILLQRQRKHRWVAVILVQALARALVVGLAELDVNPLVTTAVIPIAQKCCVKRIIHWEIGLLPVIPMI